MIIKSTFDLFGNKFSFLSTDPQEPAVDIDIVNIDNPQRGGSQSEGPQEHDNDQIS